MDYDNWKTTPPEDVVATQCDHCDEDIMQGADAYVTQDNDVVHEECWKEYSLSLLGAQLQRIVKPEREEP